MLKGYFNNSKKGNKNYFVFQYFLYSIPYNCCTKYLAYRHPYRCTVLKSSKIVYFPNITFMMLCILRILTPCGDRRVRIRPWLHIILNSCSSSALVFWLGYQSAQNGCFLFVCVC